VDIGLRGKKAIVTGASKGVGLATARELVGEGADVVICARHAQELAAAAAEIDGAGSGTVHQRAADVSEPGQVQEFVDWAARSMGGLDVLVNNAGGAHPGTFGTLTDRDWEADLRVKLFAMIRFSRCAVPHMRRRGGGRIININSVLGRSPDPGLFATSVNRAACISFSKTLALELASDGILVNSVNLGSIETPQWENIRARRAPDVPAEEFFRRAAEAIPLRRFGRADEVAAVVAFLAGDRASYVTGASIDVAGGAGGHL
jgi:3-oxoacyl-[acyl-carrier protein] reductase